MGPASQLPGQRRSSGFTIGSTSSALCTTENEWKAELRNRTEQIRLDMLLLQMKRERRLEEKRLSVALRHMASQAEVLRQRRASVTHYADSGDQLGRMQSAHAPCGPDHSFFLTQTYPRYLMAATDDIPAEHGHPDGEGEEDCETCLQITQLIHDYRQWKDTMQQRRGDTVSTPKQPASRGPTLSQPYLARREPSPQRSQTMSQITIPSGSTRSPAVRAITGVPRDRKQVSGRPLSHSRSVSTLPNKGKPLEEYLGQDHVTAYRLQTFLSRQKSFNDKNPVPVHIKLETDHNHTQPPVHLLEPKSRMHISKSRMISEALQLLDIHPKGRGRPRSLRCSEHSTGLHGHNSQVKCTADFG